MNWAGLYEYGTATALGGLWLFLLARQVRLHRWRGLWVLLTAPLFFLAWYALIVGEFVYGCIRLSGAGC